MDPPEVIILPPRRRRRRGPPHELWTLLFTISFSILSLFKLEPLARNSVQDHNSKIDLPRSRSSRSSSNNNNKIDAPQPQLQSDKVDATLLLHENEQEQGRKKQKISSESESESESERENNTHPLLESYSTDIVCNSFRPPEVHAFVLWNPSLWESQERFLSKSPLIQMLDTFIVTQNHKAWCINIYGSARNAQGHGFCKPNGNPKEVVIVKDLKPNYGVWKTPGAKQVLNTNIYGLKSELRNLANDGFKSVHSSNNVEEAKLVLDPLNRKVADYSASDPHFESVKDIFNLLDKHTCLKYVVLRSHEEIHKGFISKDIDILVNDFFMFKAITGAQSNHPKEIIT